MLQKKSESFAEEQDEAANHGTRFVAQQRSLGDGSSKGMTTNSSLDDYGLLLSFDDDSSDERLQ